MTITDRPLHREGHGEARIGIASRVVDPSGWWAGVARWYRGRCTRGLLKTLIQAGDWNDPSDDERTVRTIDRWLRHGADPNGRWRRTWASVGEYNGWDETPALLLLLSRSWGLDVVWDPSPDAVPDGHALVALDRLLNAGADPNAAREVSSDSSLDGNVRTSTLGRTSNASEHRRSRYDRPLFLAVGEDLHGAVSRLLTAGARADGTDHGRTLWDLVSSVCTAQVLLDHGVDPSQPNAQGLTRLAVEQSKPPKEQDAALMALLERQTLHQTMSLGGVEPVIASPVRGRARL